MEHTERDVRTGRVVTRDLADYHVPVNADVPAIDVISIDENDPHVNDVGAKGIGEIGITGLAAAIANAVYHATGRASATCPSRPTSCCDAWAELGDIVARARAANESGQAAVLLATLVSVRGSSYRRPGRAAADRVRRRGCAAASAAAASSGIWSRRGWWRVEGGGPALVTYDSTRRRRRLRPPRRPGLQRRRRDPDRAPA